MLEFKNSITNFGISLNQKIYTPEDIKETKLITDDRPYAGWLYVGLSANYKTESRSHTLELDLGVIGPDSLGEEFQNNFDNLFVLLNQYKNTQILVYQLILLGQANGRHL